MIRSFALDGPDGAGKTTLAMMVGFLLERCGVVVKRVREPGGTGLGEEVRRLLKDPRFKNMYAETAVLLFNACRAELYPEITKFLEEKPEGLVLSDRCHLSTSVYQILRGANRGWIDGVQMIFTGMPEKIAVVDLPAEESQIRNFAAALYAGKELDHMDNDSLEELQAVRLQYLKLMRVNPVNFYVVNGYETIEDNALRIAELLVEGRKVKEMPSKEMAREIYLTETFWDIHNKREVGWFEHIEASKRIVEMERARLSYPKREILEGGMREDWSMHMLSSRVLSPEKSSPGRERK